MKQYFVISFLFLAGYLQTFSQCGNINGDIWENTWESCETAQNPNSNHADGHWILYDFGNLYTLTTTHIWNTNELGKTDHGFRNITVDYSLNGIDWLELGNFELEEGSGEARYGGFQGFDFGGQCARYVLITALDNWGHSDCYGIAEIKFNTEVNYNGECDVITATLESETNGGIDFNLYPNPTADWLYVKIDGFTGEAELKILTIDGKLVLTESLILTGNSQLTYPVDHLPAGAYFLNIQTESSTTTQQFITIR